MITRFYHAKTEAEHSKLQDLQEGRGGRGGQEKKREGQARAQRELWRKIARQMGM
jgi:hypothetical protein